MTATGERGMSLVEATIILAVIAVLSAISAPAVGTYLGEARNTKAVADAQAIGSAIDLVMRNTGTFCLSLNAAAAAPCANSTSGRVELLVSGTTVNADEPPTVVTADFAAPASTASSTTLNWAGATNEVADARRDTMDNQFVKNTPSGAGANLYAVPTFAAGGGPRPALGWRGPYINGPIDQDPWGYMYQASTVFLGVASDAAAGTGTGQKQGGWTSDVVVLSPGGNGTVQTAFGSSSTTGVGDDIVYVVQGGTR
jgi:type II secretory pathway pseudopilin PulG